MVCLALLPWAIVSGRCRSTGEEHSRVCDHRSNRSEWSPSSPRADQALPGTKGGCKKTRNRRRWQIFRRFEIRELRPVHSQAGLSTSPMHIYLQDAASQTANVVFVGRVLVQKLSIALAMSRPYRPLTDLCD